MLIVDTGPLLATADAADPHHAACRALLETHPGPLVTTALVVTEAGWLIRRQVDMAAEAGFYRAISDGEVVVEALTNEDWARVGELIQTYSDLGIDAADASVIAVAERYGETTIATLDQRDFRVVRPRHADAFVLVP